MSNLMILILLRINFKDVFINILYMSNLICVVALLYVCLYVIDLIISTVI